MLHNAKEEKHRLMRRQQVKKQEKLLKYKYCGSPPKLQGLQEIDA